MCSQHEETVDHIVSGCEVLAKTEYISRHDKAAAYLHWNICQDHDTAGYRQVVRAQARVCDAQQRQQNHYHVGHARQY